MVNPGGGGSLPSHIPLAVGPHGTVYRSHAGTPCQFEVIPPATTAAGAGPAMYVRPLRGGSVLFVKRPAQEHLPSIPSVLPPLQEEPADTEHCEAALTEPPHSVSLGSSRPDAKAAGAEPSPRTASLEAGRAPNEGVAPALAASEYQEPASPRTDKPQESHVLLPSVHSADPDASAQPNEREKVTPQPAPA